MPNKSLHEKDFVGYNLILKLRRDSGLLEQYVALGVAGRAAFGNNDFRRGPVNVAVIRLEQNGSLYRKYD